MLYLMLAVAILTWSLHFAISAALWLIGWIVLPVLTYRSAVREEFISRFGRTLLRWRSPLIQKLYGNDEDGIDGTRNFLRDEYGLVMQEKWLAETRDYSDIRRIIVWSCWRNPSGNLRFVKPFGFVINQYRVRYVGNSTMPEEFCIQKPGCYWYFAWHDLYSGLWCTFPDYDFKTGRCYSQLRLGWKILPTDAHGLSDDDYRTKGCGFALQLHRVPTL